MAPHQVLTEYDYDLPLFYLAVAVVVCCRYMPLLQPRSFETRVQLVAYLVHQFGQEGVEVIKVVKLIVLADIYALRHQGEAISNDRYFAMKKGPVASSIADIAEQSVYVDDLQYLQEFLERDGSSLWGKVRAKKVDDDYLSENDTTVLDYIFNHYKDLSPEELIEKTHEYHAWKKHEKLLQSGHVRVPLDPYDFLENDGELAAPEEKVRLFREFYGKL